MTKTADTITMKTFIRSVEWKNDHILLLDQQQLPNQTVYIPLSTIEQVWDSIHALKVRGAPAIGIAAAFGLALWASQSTQSSVEQFLIELKAKRNYLASSRPTAVNLEWALDRLLNKVSSIPEVADAKNLLLKEALKVQREDEEVCRKIGEYGLSLLNDGDTILTHCNAGGIATARYGTALAPLYLAKEKGWNISVYADETRPVLQGARLTAWELMQVGIDVTLITDNMSAHVMKTKGVKAIIVGTDRIAANGDVANKIGTYGLALQAKALGIPFYVASPLSTIDLSTKTGDDIVIEERSSEEVTQIGGVNIAPEGIKVFNPAFDITPNELVTAIITEKGIIRGNFLEELKRLFL